MLNNLQSFGAHVLTPVPQLRKPGKSLTSTFAPQPVLVWLISLVVLVVLLTGLGRLIVRKRRIQETQR